MKTFQIQKKDSDVVVIKKIAEQVVAAALRSAELSKGKSDPTAFSYGNTQGGGFGEGTGTGLTYTIQFNMFGVSGTPTVLTYKARQKLTAEGGVHLYDVDAAGSIAQVRLNPVNNPMIAFALL